MRYITFRGGPFDGRREGIMDSVTWLQKSKHPDNAFAGDWEMSQDEIHSYRQSEKDPSIFDYEGQRK